MITKEREQELLSYALANVPMTDDELRQLIIKRHPELSDEQQDALIKAQNNGKSSKMFKVEDPKVLKMTLVERIIWAKELGKKAPQNEEEKKRFREIEDEQKHRIQQRISSELHKLRKRAACAESVSAKTLKEALSQWMRFNIPGKSPNTKSRIQRAVLLYCTDPEKRSLAKIAKEFRVTTKTVSLWFKAFTEATGQPIVTHKKHESVRSQAHGATSKRNGRLFTTGSGHKDDDNSFFDER